MTFLQNAVGGIQGPFDSFLALRGLKTLHLRMKAHCENAQFMAERLEAIRPSKKSIYPGLASHPQHALAKTPDARLRRHGQRLAERRLPGSQALHGALATVHLRRVAWAAWKAWPTTRR